MRGRYAETVVTKKRASSRDFINAYDREESSGHLAIGTAKDAGNPHWRHSLVHVLVATISSFLFGYHLGVVNETLESISFDLGFSGNTMAEGLVVSTCLGGAFVGICIQWLDSGWCWAPQGVPALCFTNDNWGFNECNNKRSVGYASREVFCWNWDGNWPTCCGSLCDRGFTSLCKGYVWEFDPNFDLSWTYGIFAHWNSSQGNYGLVAHLFLGFCHPCCNSRCFYGVLC
ncbi:hypothetical protein OIU77_023810 [Salix suchowensis]|uniref:Uncharacterized protein n=1 Tax=Salix suchowensis TaxID=1278906 RepID=A0ABQ9C6Y7_9ROSI|nr:hypothetical protein OIU77_023810 [Salix suchowensis]